ncbi:MAG: response regulator [Acidobacteria bacterium]|nr:response regulator [Acidobacteriota bacterium]
MKKILVVDDEEDVCTYLGRLFREHGYAVAFAADGNQALAEVEKDKPDLVTLDLSMPGKSGVKFYREIKARPDLSGVAVVMVTGVTGLGGNPADTERFYRTRHQAPPPEGFVAKPIDRDEILAVVNRLIGPGERE